MITPVEYSLRAASISLNLAVMRCAPRLLVELFLRREG